MIPATVSLLLVCRLIIAISHLISGARSSVHGQRNIACSNISLQCPHGLMPAGGRTARWMNLTRTLRAAQVRALTVHIAINSSSVWILMCMTTY